MFFFLITVFLCTQWALSNQNCLGGGRPRNSGSVSGRGKNYFPLHRVHTGSGANLASYSLDTRASFCGDKAAGAWSQPLICGVEDKNGKSYISIAAYAFVNYQWPHLCSSPLNQLFTNFLIHAVPLKPVGQFEDADIKKTICSCIARKLSLNRISQYCKAWLKIVIISFAPVE
jgi:hypothetical protein